MNSKRIIEITGTPATCKCRRQFGISHLGEGGRYRLNYLQNHGLAAFQQWFHSTLPSALTVAQSVFVCQWEESGAESWLFPILAGKVMADFSLELTVIRVNRRPQ